MKLLKKIDSPKDLRKLKKDQLQQVSDELRQYIIDTITVAGGHFGGGLGVIELTVALHYVFDTPKDRLIWDIGHQAYPHKVLTGRRDKLHTIRKAGGLAPFLKIGESIYDHFGAGHTATSLSAAFGMAKARDLQKRKYNVAAIIGDGAMTGGLPFEALNNIGASDTDLIMVLNDNQMSIDPNCGSMCTHLDELVSGKAKGNIFKALGVQYFGPFDGHDMSAVLKALEAAKKRPGPQLLHFRTEKGHGYQPAKTDYNKSHAISTGGKAAAPKYNKVYGDTMIKLAKKDKKIVVVTPAMAAGSGLNPFGKELPDRFFDVAIAEQHAVTFSAGLAREGMKPFATIYSTFLQRAYDQVIHDVCVQNLPVRFFLDRGGLVGADGATHNGVFDLSYLRCLPNMVIAVPRDEEVFVDMIHLAAKYDDGPIAVRYPRGTGVGPGLLKGKLKFGQAEVLRKGKDVVIVAVGPWIYDALELAEELKDKIDVAVIDARFVKPLDTKTLQEFTGIKRWISLEDNSVLGGLGSAIAEWLVGEGSSIKLTRVGVPDKFAPHGSVADVRKIIGCDKEAIRKAILE